MATGTVYSVKADLLNAIKSKVFTNNNFSTSAADIQINDLDIVESLWDRGVTLTAFATYSDFLTALSGSQLTPGALYSVPYQCVHLIPGTSDLNTSSAQYVSTIETFHFKALKTNVINPWVKSIDNPNDLILWDVSQNTAEDAITARSGKVLYREDGKNQLITFYDFRGVYFRRGNVNLASSIPVWTTGLNWTRGDLTSYSGDNIRRATINMVADTTATGVRWQPVSPSSTGIKWVWKDNATYLNSVVPRTTTEDSLTFINGSKNCSIGQTTSNSGYNNIVIDTSFGVTLGKDSIDSHIISCSNFNIENNLTNSLIGVVQNSKAKEINQSYVWACSELDLVDHSGDAIYGCNDITTKSGNQDNDMSFVRMSDIGSSLVNNAFHYFINTGVGPNCFSNFFRNIENCDIQSTVNTNIFSGLRFSTVKNDVGNCDFDADSSQYGVYEHVTIEDKCSLLSCTIGGSVDRVTFGKGTNNVDITSAGNLTNVNFGEECTAITVEGDIIDTTFGANCSTIDIQSGCTVDRCDISNTCSSITLSSGGIMQDVKVGPNSSNITLSGGSTMTKTLIGSNCNTITLAGGSAIEDCWIKESVENIDLSGGSSIRKTDIGHSVNGITVDNTSSITNSNIGPDSGTLVVTNSATLSYVNMIGNNTTLTFTDSLNIAYFEIGGGLKNKTFDSSNANLSYGKTRSNDAVVETFMDSGASDQDITSPKDEIYEVVAIAAPSVITFSDNESGNFYIENSADLNIDTDEMEANVEFKVLINNTDVGAHNFVFGTNFAAPSQLTINVGATTQELHHIMRVRHGASDKIVQTRPAITI